MCLFVQLVFVLLGPPVSQYINRVNNIRGHGNPPASEFGNWPWWKSVDGVILAFLATARQAFLDTARQAKADLSKLPDLPSLKLQLSTLYHQATAEDLVKLHKVRVKIL